MPTNRLSEIAAQAERDAEKKVRAVLAEGARLTAAERAQRESAYQRAKATLAELARSRAEAADEEEPESEPVAARPSSPKSEPAEQPEEPEIPAGKFGYRGRDLQSAEWMAVNGTAYSKAAHEGKLFRIGD